MLLCVSVCDLKLVQEPDRQRAGRTNTRQERRVRREGSGCRDDLIPTGGALSSFCKAHADSVHIIPSAVSNFRLPCLTRQERTAHSQPNHNRERDRQIEQHSPVRRHSDWGE
ncbi:hypothetical protein AAFF_G00391660 [Aldrovandia affinis]|uniref:Uncharacterized protein n=1 Tax=Aldrovandia affinis TaxID=143900 RepID=A0AAD7WL20_9TELE|nr:hypothetical protein AAFF_G00391660 [Aldrovandia affinis]